MQVLSTMTPGKINMGDLADRMDTGVRPTGTDRSNLLTADTMQGLCDKRLYSESIVLDLPTDVIRPVVGDG